MAEKAGGGKDKDTFSLQAQAFLRGVIQKEQHFTAMFAKRDRERRERTGQDSFRINPAAIRPVAAPIGVRDKRRITQEMLAAEEANKVALAATLAASSRPPQERTRLPATAMQEIGWDWKEAAAITKPPLAKAYHAMSEILQFAENYSVTMGAGPFDKTQPIARSCEPASPPGKSAKK